MGAQYQVSFLKIWAGPNTFSSVSPILGDLREGVCMGAGWRDQVDVTDLFPAGMGVVVSRA